jgi:hypothetical protein
VIVALPPNDGKFGKYFHCSDRLLASGLAMPPNLLQKLLFFTEAAMRVLAAAKVKKIPFFSLFLADAGSVFGNRQDHDKHDIFVRLSKVRALASYLTHTFLVCPFCSTRAFSTSIQFPVVIKPIWGLQSVGIIGIQDRNTLERFLIKRRRPYIVQRFIREGVEIGISYTRNPAGAPDFFWCGLQGAGASINLE